MIEQAIKQIEELFKSDVTDYRISKDTGITLSVIQKYRNDTSKIENMTLKVANKLIKYMEEKRKGELTMLELKVNHNGTDKYFYGRSLEEVALESFDLFKNYEQANEYIQNENYEDFIKDYLKGELKYTGEEVQYFKDIETVWDMNYSQTLEFINSLNDELKTYIKLDTFNDEYYVECDRGAYQISEQLTELAEQFLYE